VHRDFTQPPTVDVVVVTNTGVVSTRQTLTYVNEDSFQVVSGSECVDVRSAVVAGANQVYEKEAFAAATPTLTR
jgi:hypothetical protein